MFACYTCICYICVCVCVCVCVVIERTPRPDVPIGLPRTSSDAGSLGATGHTHRSDSSSALSTSPSFSTPITNATDKLADHIIEAYPNDGDKEVDLGTTIVVTFDKDVRTVNVNKLFEVRSLA